jgi:MFS family permease
LAASATCSVAVGCSCAVSAFSPRARSSRPAGSQGALIAGRIVQGAGAAALLPLSIALVAAAFPRARQPRAFGIWAAVSAIALGIGPLAGGLLIDLTWRLIFWINLPIVALGAAIILVYARDTRDEGASHRIDVPGLLALSAGLAAAVLALVEANEWGWGSTRVPSRYRRDVLRASPAGAIRQQPCFSSPSRAAKHAPESNRGRHSQSIEPSLPTRAAVWRSPMRA